MNPASDLASGFVPPPGLGHAHVQSLLSAWPLRRRWLRHAAAPLLGTACSEVLDCGSGVRLLGHYSAHARASRGLVILLHGWEGCAESGYILSAGAASYAAGYDVFRLNFRDHGETYALNEGLFHSCRIEEVVGAVKAIIGAHPAPRIVLAGFSLGGNFALRVGVRAAEAQLALDRIIAVCPVLSPHSTMRALEDGLWVYRRYFLRRWRRSLTAKAAAFPARYDFGDLRRLRTLTATTDFFVRRYTEFDDLDSYLSGYAITGSVLASLRVPARLIAARDDPVIPSADLERLAPNDALRVTVLRRGGHCGFLRDYRLHSWLDEALVRELRVG
jgi:predicted alpha/beta-fold hydrolase